jgi:hypothetical protein
MPEDKKPKSETKSDTTYKSVKTIPEGYKKEVREGKTVYVLKREIPAKDGKGTASDTIARKTINPPATTKKATTTSTAKSTAPVKPKSSSTTTTTVPPTKKTIPKKEPEKTYTEDILTLEEEPPVQNTVVEKAPVNREVKGSANIYRRINNNESNNLYTTYDYPDESGNYTNKAIKRRFVGDQEVDENVPQIDKQGNWNPTFIKGSNLNQGANVGGLTNIMMPGDSGVNSNVEGFKGNLGAAGITVTKNATGGMGITNYANAPTTVVAPTYDAKGNKIGGGVVYDKTEAAKVNAIPGSAGSFKLTGDVAPEVTPVPKVEEPARVGSVPFKKGGVVGYADGGIVAYNANGQGIDRFGRVVPKQNYGVEQAGSTLLGAIPGMTPAAASAINKNKAANQAAKGEESDTNLATKSGASGIADAAGTTGASDGSGAAGAAEAEKASGGGMSALAGVGALGAGMGATAIDTKNKDAKGRYTSTEAAVGSSALKGAGMGAQLGANPALVGATGGASILIGAGVGAVAGAGYGLYRGDKDKKSIDTSNKKMASELASANAKTEQQKAMADRDAGVENRTSANLITKDQAMYDENDNLINPVQYAAKGGTIVGKGGPKSDSILTNSNSVKPGSFVVPAENNEEAKGIRGLLFGNKNKKAQFKKGGETDSDIAVSNGEHLFTPSERKKIVSYLGQEILEELAPNAENGNDKASGGMIKRADGSYSPRGLWDNIRANAGSGKEPTKEMLKQEAKIKSEYKSGGYVVQSSSDREGKTHKVTGPDGTVKYFGDSNLGQHPKDEDRKKAFYARHETNLKNNPFFRAYARKTWAEGGVVGEEGVDFKAQGGLLGTLTDRENMREYKKGGLTSQKAKMMLHDGTINGKPITEQQRKYFGLIASGGKETKAEGGDIFGGNKNGGKIMAPKMMYADGTPPEGTLSASEAKRLKDLQNEFTQLRDAIDKGKGNDADRYKYSQRIPQIAKEIKAIQSTSKKPITAPETNASTTGATTTRGAVKGASVVDTPGASANSPKAKVKPGKLTAEVMKPKNISLSALEQEREAGIERQMIEGEKSVLGTTERVKAQSEAENKARQDADAAAMAKKKAENKSKLSNALSGINTEALIGAGQSALGYNMLKGEKRPGYKFELDPAYQASVERQKQEAGYGLSAEQRAMANQDIANALSDSRVIARSGPNAGAAYNQETMAINEGWRNKLGLISKDQELKMAKQQISDQSIKERAGIMTGAKRQAYEDAMGRFQQIQAAGSELVGAGIRNVIGSTRLNKELEAMKAAKAQEDAYLGTVGTA